MKKIFLSKNLLLAGSILTLAFSCSGKKNESMKKGPDQEPFENCEATDSECEEGASSDAMHEEKAPALESVESAGLSSVEVELDQKIAVTPVVVEAIAKIEVEQVTAEVESVASQQETEIVSAQKLEVTEVAGE